MNAATDTTREAHRHLRVGWWSLVVFVAMGLVLEAMHGLKIGWVCACYSAAHAS